jgi:hypothetical protein
MSIGSFLLYILRRCGFREKWCNWLANCIFLACFSVLVNSTLTSVFSSSRSLGQRDPLSPLVFVIVMDMLSKMISATMNEGLVLGFLVESVET